MSDFCSANKLACTVSCLFSSGYANTLGLVMLDVRKKDPYKVMKSQRWPAVSSQHIALNRVCTEKKYLYIYMLQLTSQNHTHLNSNPNAYTMLGS